MISILENIERFGIPKNTESLPSNNKNTEESPDTNSAVSKEELEKLLKKKHYRDIRNRELRDEFFDIYTTMNLRQR